MLPLVKMRNGLLKQEAAVQKVRDQQFPQSLEQYNQLRKDIKVRPLGCSRGVDMWHSR